MNIIDAVKKQIDILKEDKIKYDDISKEITDDFEMIIEILNGLFCDTNRIVDPEELKEYINVYEKIYNNYKVLVTMKSKTFLKIFSHNDISFSVITDFLIKYNCERVKKTLNENNQRIANDQIKKAKEIINPIDGDKYLDEQQLSAILNNTHNNLVIAGAGTGKTTIIVGLVKYLILSKQYEPNEILLLSFTNTAVNNMKTRIENELEGTSCNVSTFHKLGKDIICSVEHLQPRVSHINIERFVKSTIEFLLKNDEDYKFNLYMYLSFYNTTIYTEEKQFKTKEEYEEYIHMHGLKTLLGENVKSYGELEIANFLYINGIEYIYEEPYIIDTRTTTYGQYYPDFFLPDYGIYIEYFGIDELGNVPPWFIKTTQEEANKKYKDSIKWKRQLHKRNNTTMIETFYYDKKNFTLFPKLKKQLEDNKVLFQHNKVYEKLSAGSSKEKDNIINDISRLFANIITLMKSEHLSMNDLIKKNKSVNNLSSVNMIINLIQPIYTSYQKTLIENNEIDFSDMINKAREYAETNEYKNRYKFIIIDEYQDISRASYKLLKELRNTNDYKLFCVGDDWQSIYKFAGGNVDFIVNFDKIWGLASERKAEKTYRFSQDICDTCKKFVMKNKKQKDKNIRSVKNDETSKLQCISYNNIERILMSIPENSSVMLLGRYNSDIEKFDYNVRKHKKNEHDELFEYIKTQGKNSVTVIYKERENLDIQFYTVHAAKGLEADYVFIINSRERDRGFPSTIEDSQIIKLILNDTETFTFAEERRLFYVALTRARKNTWIAIEEDNVSPFVLEIDKSDNIGLKHILSTEIGRYSIGSIKHIQQSEEIGAKTNG